MVTFWKECLALLKHNKTIQLVNGATIYSTERFSPTFELRRNHKEMLWVECNTDAILETLRILLMDVKYSMRYCARRLPTVYIVDSTQRISVCQPIRKRHHPSSGTVVVSSMLQACRLHTGRDRGVSKGIDEIQRSHRRRSDIFDMH